MSLPPQCGGPDLVGWDWGTVDGETKQGGTTWGEYVVVGTFDEMGFTPSAPPALATPADRPPPDPLPDYSTSCPEPAGGWIPRVPGDANDDLLSPAAARYLKKTSDTSAVWVDQTRTQMIWNVRFTRNAAGHRKELMALMPPNLCVTQGGRSRRELDAIAATEINAVPAANRLGGMAFEVTGTVEVQVVLDRDGVLQRTLDARYGRGLVRVKSALTPIE